MYADEKKIALVTTFLGLVFGALLVFITPPFQAADEDSHFKRAFAISELNLLPDEAVGQGAGHFFPAAILDFETAHRDLIDNFRHRYSWRRLQRWSAEVQIDYSQRRLGVYSAAVLHPYLYLPQAAGIALGKALGNNTPLTLMQSGRLANLIFFWCCVGLALLIIPIGRMVLALLSLMPMTFSLTSSLSYDAVALGISALLAAVLLRLALDPRIEKIGWTQMVPAALLSIYLFELKHVYFWFVLLWFLIPSRKFSSRWIRWGSLGLVVAASLILHTAWRAAWDFTAVYPYSPAYHEQLNFISNKPLQYGLIWWQSLLRGEIFQLKDFVGNLGWRDNNLPLPFIQLYWLGLIAAAAVDQGPGNGLDRRGRLLVLGIGFLITFSVSTALYLIWTALPNIGGIGYPHIFGVQGRYFIPLGLLLAPLLGGTRLAVGVRPDLKALLVLGAGLLSISLTIFFTLLRYYY